jgi:predicted porin
MRYDLRYPAAAVLGLGLSVGAIDVAAADELSDLQSENRELREAVELLRGEVDRIKEMVAKQNAAIAPAAGPPEKIVSSGNDKVSLEVSGQVNRLVLYADDGDQARFFHADNDESSTRVRFKGKAKLNDDISAGALIEVQMESNSTADVTIDQNKSVIASNSFTERKLEVFFESKMLGKLSIGQGDTASNGSTEVDLSGTGVIGLADNSALASSIAFVLSGTQGTSSGVTVGNVLNNQDGLSRDDRLRYDTPTFVGARLSTSWIDGDEWDVALRYGREFNGTEVALALAYWDAATTDDLDGYGGSASVLLPFGTNLTGAYSMQDIDLVAAPNAQAGLDSGFWYAKLGQQLDLTSLGKTSLAIDYSESDDQNADGTEAMAYGFMAVQKISEIGAEIYGTVRQYDVDIPAVSTEEVTIGAAGARIKF